MQIFLKENDYFTLLGVFFFGLFLTPPMSRRGGELNLLAQRCTISIVQTAIA